MRIACPNCDAAYDVPDSMLAPGRTVRCARCGRDWAPVPAPAAAILPAPPAAAMPVPPAAASPVPPAAAMPAAPEPAPTAEPPEMARPSPPLLMEAPAPVPMDRQPLAASAPRPSAPVHVPVLAGWIVSVAVLLGLAWAAYAWRAEIMRAWPPSARVYVALGLAGR